MFSPIKIYIDPQHSSCWEIERTGNYFQIKLYSQHFCGRAMRETEWYQFAKTYVELGDNGYWFEG